MMDLIVSYLSLARNKFENKNPLRLLMEVLLFWDRKSQTIY